MDIDAQALAPPIANRSCRSSLRHPRASRLRSRGAVIVPRIAAVECRAAEHHDFVPFEMRIVVPGVRCVRSRL
jgi:hypothetical protein